MVTLPKNICRYGRHQCFGYRVLEDSFKTLSEVLHSVTELCGTHDLLCPIWNPPPSPEANATPLPATWSSSPQRDTGPIITEEDYMQSEEAVEEWILELQQAAENGERTPNHPGVINCLILPHERH